MQTHEMFDGRLQVYKRDNSRNWQCAARVGGVRYRATTGEESLDRAKDVAEEWYLDLRGKMRRGEIVRKERTFREAAEGYIAEMKVLAAGVRSAKYIELTELRINRHVLPFFGDTALPDINKGLVQAYRVKRNEETIKLTARPAQPATKDKPARPAVAGHAPARSTMLQEIVAIRQVLKFAEGRGWIPFVPSLATPYLTQGKRGRRAWFSPEEYKQLYEATGRRIKDGKRPGWRPHYEDLHDFVLMMANTGLRPDEALKLEFRDVSVEEDATTRTTLLVIDVRGKTGVGFCKSTPNAVWPFQRLRERRQGQLAAQGLELAATDRVFPRFDRDLFNTILEEEGLKLDRDGQRRTAYSLRHTYISMRLMEGANIYQIANNCRTSVEMIEKHYAAHIKDRLDAAAINVERPKAVRRRAKVVAKKTKPATPSNPPLRFTSTDAG